MIFGRDTKGDNSERILLEKEKGFYVFIKIIAGGIVNIYFVVKSFLFCGREREWIVYNFRTSFYRIFGFHTRSLFKKCPMNNEIRKMVFIT